MTVTATTQQDEVKATSPATDVSPAPLQPWSILGQPTHLNGFAYGLAYPSVRLMCVIPATTPAERAALFTRFEALFAEAKGLARVAPFVDPSSGNERNDTIDWFCALAERLQQLADLPVYARPVVMRAVPPVVSFALPVLSRGLEPTTTLLSLACKAFAAPEGDLADLQQQAESAFARLLASALPTSNTPRFVKAAVEHGIAFQEMPGTLVQYGIGRKSVLMDGTFTQYCSNIGARVARFKHQAASLLQRAGLPAPKGAIAVNVDQALAYANALGYPVVVKPADKDGGVAVQADLRNDDEVRAAFEVAAKVSKLLLVEKFVTGRDYRITVFRGKAIWAVERVPAGVTGDGSATVQQLVDTANQDPRRGDTVSSALKKLKLDDEALGLLERDGFTLDSVPEDGQFVRLRRSSNVSNGGMPVVVTNRMHPDNARLAERAAETVGLDLCGVDLIIPDISTSWREVDAGICEVNAQPELGGLTAGHLYPMILKSLVKGDGHVPTIAVLGGPESQNLTASLVAALSAQGICVGSHDQTGVRVGQETIRSEPVGALLGGRSLTMDRKVEAIVLGLLDDKVVAQGLPVQRIDVLLLTGSMPTFPDAAGVPAEATLAELLRITLPHCKSVAVLAKDTGIDPRLAQVLRSTRKVETVITPDKHQALFGKVVNGVVGAVRAVRKPARAAQAKPSAS